MTNNLKFLCSYGGKLVPRHSDGKLRYLGGQTRVLAVDRSISFSGFNYEIGRIRRRSRPVDPAVSVAGGRSGRRAGLDSLRRGSGEFD
ncbi:hypothetical protein LINPERHAP1_LOCUS35521 [Linum perenne]